MKIDLILGDCLMEMNKLSSNSIDMVLTSPPYDNLRSYDGYDFNFEGIAKELFRLLKQGGVIVWVVGDATIQGSETGTSFKQALFFKELGLNIHDTMIYNKGTVIFPDPNRYHQCFEYMFVFSKGTPNTINLLSDRKNKWGGSWGKKSYRQKDGSLLQKEMIPLKEYGPRFNIWDITCGYMHTTLDTYAFEHPAMFPESLAEGHILSWSKEGDTILDPMMGSGTTGKMAKMNKRSFIGIEISEKYMNIAKKRILNAQEAML